MENKKIKKEALGLMHKVLTNYNLPKQEYYINLYTNNSFIKEVKK